MLRNVFVAGVIAVTTSTLALANPASAAQVFWTDWTSLTLGTPGSATGVITLGDGSTVNVTYSGEVLSPSQISGDNNYWNPSDPYINSEVSNVPSTNDIIALQGQSSQEILNTLTFSKALVNPYFAVVSLGQSWLNVSYNFGQDFDIVKQDRGYWGGTSSSLAELADDVLLGNEGHGVLRFNGSVDTISWTATPGEYWHGFTVGTAQAVPTPALLPGLIGMGIAAIRRQRKGESGAEEV